MFRVTELLVPQGTLRVEDTWQEIHVDGTAGAARLVGWHLTLRAAYLNGGLVVYGPGTRDLLDAAAWAIDGGPPETLIMVLQQVVLLVTAPLAMLIIPRSGELPCSQSPG